MKIVIGIITHRRPKQLVQLLRHLCNQLGESDQVWVLENGSRQLSSRLIASVHPQISLIWQNKAGIPTARNFLFEKAKQTQDVLIFLDDDVIVSRNWLRKFKQVLIQAQKQHSSVVQGNFKSFPQQNLYAQTTGILNQLWLKANEEPHSLTKVIDTKHVGFLLKDLQNFPNPFNPTYKFASDIALSAKLITHYQIKIYFASQLFVFHQERLTWLSFLNHRYRLSRAFRKVASAYPSFFSSESTVVKFKTLWQKLQFNSLKKLWILFSLVLIYAAVWVSNSITSFRRLWSKFALK